MKPAILHLPLALCLTLSLLGLPGLAQSEDPCPADGVDALLRSCRAAHPTLGLPIPPVGCRQHRSDLAQLSIDGKTYSWQDYASWGRQLFARGYVVDPPAGPFDPWDPQRSQLISDFADYSCGRCHNDVREDPVLIDQDPEARYDFIRHNYPDADYRTSRIKMVQGVTLWGGVNRVRFYNGLFSFFDSICVPVDTTLYRSPEDPQGRIAKTVDCGGSRFAPCAPGCRQLDTASFRDAIQTCGRYCGVGRFMEDWEIAGLLTHFWDGQVLLGDVLNSLEQQLMSLEEQSPPPAQKIAAVRWKLHQLKPWLASPKTSPPIGACQALADSFLLTSCESLRDASPDDPDNEACSRDWTAPPPPADIAAIDDPEDLPAMIRHLLGKSPGRPEAPQLTERPRTFLPFVSDSGLELAASYHQATPATPQLQRGKDLYQLSCGRCHGISPEGRPQVGGRGHRFLVGSSHVYFKMVEDGLTPKNPIPPNPQNPSQESLYMPEFTLQRLSYQQVEDMYQYLLSLPPSGRVMRQEPTPPAADE